MTDPLNLDTFNVVGKGVDTSFPVLVEGDYSLQITESSPKPNKAGTGYNWNMTLSTIDPAKTKDGKDVAPGYKVYVNNIALQPKDEAEDKKAYEKFIFQAVDAIYGTDASDRPDFNKACWEGAIGRTVKVQLSIEEFPEGSGSFKNRVHRWKK